MFKFMTAPICECRPTLMEIAKHWIVLYGAGFFIPPTSTAIYIDPGVGKSNSIQGQNYWRSFCTHMATGSPCSLSKIRIYSGISHILSFINQLSAL